MNRDQIMACLHDQIPINYKELLIQKIVEMIKVNIVKYKTRDNICLYNYYDWLDDEGEVYIHRDWESLAINTSKPKTYFENIMPCLTEKFPSCNIFLSSDSSFCGLVKKYRITIFFLVNLE